MNTLPYTPLSRPDEESFHFTKQPIFNSEKTYPSISFQGRARQLSATTAQLTPPSLEDTTPSLNSRKVLTLTPQKKTVGFRINDLFRTDEPEISLAATGNIKPERSSQNTLLDHISLTPSPAEESFLQKENVTNHIPIRPYPLTANLVFPPQESEIYPSLAVPQSPYGYLFSQLKNREKKLSTPQSTPQIPNDINISIWNCTPPSEDYTDFPPVEKMIASLQEQTTFVNACLGEAFYQVPASPLQRKELPSTLPPRSDPASKSQKDPKLNLSFILN
jgi:hypothetical protein